MKIELTAAFEGSAAIIKDEFGAAAKAVHNVVSGIVLLAQPDKIPSEGTCMLISKFMVDSAQTIFVEGTIYTNAREEGFFLIPDVRRIELDGGEIVQIIGTDCQPDKLMLKCITLE